MAFLIDIELRSLGGCAVRLLLGLEAAGNPESGSDPRFAPTLVVRDTSLPVA